MKKVLIPTDSDTNNTQIIDFVIEFFNDESCHFYFLNTYSYEVYGLSTIDLLQEDDDWFEKPKTSSSQLVCDLINKFTRNSKYDKHEFSAISECSKLIEEIRKNVLDIDPDLIVLVNKKKHAISKNLLGIINNVRVRPTLILPNTEIECKISKIVITSDLEFEISNFEMKKLFKIIDSINLGITILVPKRKDNLSNNAQANLKMLENELKSRLDRTVKLEYINSAADIEKFIISNQNTLICTIDKKPDFFRKIGLHNSSTVNLIKNAINTPILNVHQ